MDTPEDKPKICGENIGGDGADTEHIPAENDADESQDKGASKRKGPLKINGSLNDVLRAAIRKKPKED